MLVFGHSGDSILFFPARMGRFYDYENWRVIEALRPKIEDGQLQIYCIDSNDRESFYDPVAHPYYRIQRQVQYEHYILNEVLPLIREKNHDASIVAAGCSLGAYHAVNTALRHPGVFKRVVAMSGRYDLTRQIGHYNDLLGNYWDENIYFNMPLQYLPNLTDENTLRELSHTDLVLVVGNEDVVKESNLALHHLITSKGINSTMHLWDHEAHQARAWRQMVALYL